MSSVPTESECVSALEALYTLDDPARKHLADQYLIQLQKSTHAWSIGDALLRRDHTPTIAEQAYFYAASTLHTKILLASHELGDPAQRRGFRDAVLEHLARRGAASRPLRGRLAQLTASVMVVQLGTQEWRTAINDVVSLFSGNIATLPILLDVLACLPEEAFFSKLQVHSSVRAQAQRAVLATAEQVLTFLMQCLATASRNEGVGAAVSVLRVGQDYISSGILNTPNSGQHAVLLPPPASPVQRDLQGQVLHVFRMWVKAARKFAYDAPSGPSTTPQPLSSEGLIDHPLILFCLKLLASAPRLDDGPRGAALEVLQSLVHLFHVPHPKVLTGFRSAALLSRAISSSDGDDDGVEVDAQEEGEVVHDTVAAHGSSRFQHIYFMQFLATRILELKGCFDALPPLTPEGARMDAEGNTEEDHVASAARTYCRLFSDLGCSYLQMILDFSLGAEAFAGDSPNNVVQLQHLRAAMAAHGQVVLMRQAAAAGQAAAPIAPVAVSDSDVAAQIESCRQLSLSIASLQLHCAQHPRRLVAAHSLFFFNILRDALVEAPTDLGPRRHISHHQGNGVNGINGFAAPAAPTVSPLHLRAKRRDLFKQLFEQLVAAIHRLLCYPGGYVPLKSRGAAGVGAHIFNADADDEVDRIRGICERTLNDVESILQYGPILSVLVTDNVIGGQLAAFRADPVNQWRALEASLCMVRVLGSRVCNDLEHANRYQSPAQSFAQGGVSNSTLLPKVFSLLLDEQSPVMGHKVLTVTSLNILCTYAYWIREHGRAQAETARAAAAAQPGAAPPAPLDYLPRVMSVIVDALREPVSCHAASKALSQMCLLNSVRLANTPAFMDALMHVYSVCCSFPVLEARRGSSSGAPALHFMTLADQKDIIMGVSRVVCFVEPVPVTEGAGGAAIDIANSPLARYMGLLVQPMVNDITAVFTAAQQAALQAAANAAPPGTAPQQPVEYPLTEQQNLQLNAHLERLGETTANLVLDSHSENHMHQLAALLQMYRAVLAPMLYALMNHMCNDERRMDKTVRVVKWIIKDTKLAFVQDALTPLLVQLHSSFSRYQHACFLYLLTICIKNLGVHPQFVQMLSELHPPFLRASLRAIPNLQALIHDPDMTEDFFDSVAATVNLCPALFFQLDFINEIFERAVQGLLVQHRQSLSAITQFLCTFLLGCVNTERRNRDRGEPVNPAYAAKIQQALHAGAQELSRGLVLSVATAQVLDNFDFIGNVIQAFFEAAERQRFEPIMRWALQFVPATADPTHDEFLQHVVTSCSGDGDGRLRERLLRFASACRVEDEIRGAHRH